MACRLLLPTRLSVALPLVAAVLILVAGIFLLIERRNPVFDRWGRAVCSAGVAIYLMFPLATIAGGDIEGGIPVGPQVVWQTVAIGAVIAATPLLIVGGALLLLRGPQVKSR